jgi:hypothetical protein
VLLQPPVCRPVHVETHPVWLTTGVFCTPFVRRGLRWIHEEDSVARADPTVAYCRTLRTKGVDAVSQANRFFRAPDCLVALDLSTQRRSPSGPGQWRWRRTLSRITPLKTMSIMAFGTACGTANGSRSCSAASATWRRDAVADAAQDTARATARHMLAFSRARALCRCAGARLHPRARPCPHQHVQLCLRGTASGASYPLDPLTERCTPLLETCVGVLRRRFSTEQSVDRTIFSKLRGLGEMAVALGAAHVLAVAEDGTLLAWGAGAHGQLGT